MNFIDDILNVTNTVIATTTLPNSIEITTDKKLLITSTVDNVCLNAEILKHDSELDVILFKITFVDTNNTNVACSTSCLLGKTSECKVDTNRVYKTIDNFFDMYNDKYAAITNCNISQSRVDDILQTLQIVLDEFNIKHTLPNDGRNLI